MSIRYKDLVPADSFIGQYMSRMDDLETPLIYDFWSAVWCISSVVGREVYVNRPQIPVRLNEFIILVAESGITRKGANIGLASELVRKMVPELIHNRTSSEALELIMHEQSRLQGTAHVAICCPELTSILGRKISHNMPELLTDLYDCAKERIGGGTIERGRTHHTNVYPTLLSASTPAWLGTAINPSVIEGGFTSRCIFVCARRRKQIVAWPDEERLDDLDGLRATLQECRDGSRSIGGLGITKSARTKFVNWYKKRGQSDDPFRSSFEAREDDHVLRLAGILSINDRLYEIQSGHIGAAIKLVGEVKQSASEMFGVDTKRTRTVGDGIEKFREIFIDLPEGELIAHSKLYTKLRWTFNIEEFKLVVGVMQETGLINVYQKRGKTGTFYSATPKLTMPGSITEAVDRLSLHRSDVI